ncbi:hypothetical protein PYW07_003531 [Mythimna separata]|uniref:Uncharacterized protein n=1 Tax=Mythimna separata TaxID=271217 RepID=A0AAD8DQZ1_MYTSE|nr:hypothetical protein PYW07_003531 [Mythimna separata]
MYRRGNRRQRSETPHAKTWLKDPLAPRRQDLRSGSQCGGGGGVTGRLRWFSVARGADMSGTTEVDKRPGQAGEVDAESVLRQLGQLGPFHLRAYALLALAALQVGLLHTTYIFLAGSVPYRYVLNI